MRRLLSRLAVTGAVVAGTVVAVQSPAHAIWHYHSGPYPNLNSCLYAGHYYSQYNNWEDWDCFISSGPVWALMWWD